MDYTSFPQPLDLPQGCVVAVGNFDGVHAGHRALLHVAREHADREGLPLVVLTFEPHPRSVLFPDIPLKRLTDAGEKTRLLIAAGVDHVAVMEFTPQLAEWSAERFIDEALVSWLDARQVVVGANFRFGHKAAGHVETLAQDARFVTVVVPLVEDAEGVISSRRLRG